MELPTLVYVTNDAKSSEEESYQFGRSFDITDYDIIEDFLAISYKGDIIVTSDYRENETYYNRQQKQIKLTPGFNKITDPVYSSKYYVEWSGELYRVHIDDRTIDLPNEENLYTILVDPEYVYFIYIYQEARGRKVYRSIFYVLASPIIDGALGPKETYFSKEDNFVFVPKDGSMKWYTFVYTPRGLGKAYTDQVRDREGTFMFDGMIGFEPDIDPGFTVETPTGFQLITKDGDEFKIVDFTYHKALQLPDVTPFVMPEPINEKCSDTVTFKCSDGRVSASREEVASISYALYRACSGNDFQCEKEIDSTAYKSDVVSEALVFHEIGSIEVSDDTSIIDLLIFADQWDDQALFNEVVTIILLDPTSFVNDVSMRQFLPESVLGLAQLLVDNCSSQR